MRTKKADEQGGGKVKKQRWVRTARAVVTLMVSALSLLAPLAVSALIEPMDSAQSDPCTASEAYDAEGGRACGFIWSDGRNQD